jgi:hypothetical protein
MVRFHPVGNDGLVLYELNLRMKTTDNNKKKRATPIPPFLEGEA